MKIKAIIWQEDDVWCASVPALPGCHTWGESYEHLLEMLEDAVQGWLEVASDRVSIIFCLHSKNLQFSCSFLRDQSFVAL